MYRKKSIKRYVKQIPVNSSKTLGLPFKKKKDSKPWKKEKNATQPPTP